MNIMKEQDPSIISGNTILIWIGNFLKTIGSILTEKGNKLISKGEPLIISNPSVELLNPFTLLAKFTINSKDSYQLVIQSNYIIHYKEDRDLTKLTEREKFDIIRQNQKLWFLKSNEI